MRREISNPSDYATIECSDDFLAACLAVLILGAGKYGIVDDNCPEGRMPIFLLGGHDEWLKNRFGGNFRELLKRKGNRLIAAALDSVQLRGKRSAMNDIVKSARVLAERLRESL